MEQINLPWRKRAQTVSELTASIKAALHQGFSDVWVAGEISGLKPAASGHLYFTLKDSGAQVRAVCFKSSLRFLRVKPRDGLAVLARGRIDVYEPRGEYQFLVEAMEAQGLGALQAAFEELKKRLAAEGLFDADRKRPLPRYPRRIGIVTSATGAVIQDMVGILARRHPGIHIRLFPAQVQGPGSVEAVVEGVRHFSESGWADLLIVGRGGGSLEDLWTFNEEPVARAIAECRIPVISAVGHDTDFTIADFVADLRAPTPSAAAELAVTDKASLMQQVDAALARASRAAHYRLSQARTRTLRLGIDRARADVERKLGRAAQKLDDLDSRSRRAVEGRVGPGWTRLRSLELRLQRQEPRVRLAADRARWAALTEAVVRGMRARLERSGRRLVPADAALRQLSPLGVLERGYAIVLRADGQVVRSADETGPGQQLEVRVRRGSLLVEVRSNGKSGATPTREGY